VSRGREWSASLGADQLARESAPNASGVTGFGVHRVQSRKKPKRRQSNEEYDFPSSRFGTEFHPRPSLRGETVNILTRHSHSGGGSEPHRKFNDIYETTPGAALLGRGAFSAVKAVRVKAELQSSPAPAGLGTGSGSQPAELNTLHVPDPASNARGVHSGGASTARVATTGAGSAPMSTTASGASTPVEDESRQSMTTMQLAVKELSYVSDSWHKRRSTRPALVAEVRNVSIGEVIRECDIWSCVSHGSTNDSLSKFSGSSLLTDAGNLAASSGSSTWVSGSSGTVDLDELRLLAAARLSKYGGRVAGEMEGSAKSVSHEAAADATAHDDDPDPGADAADTIVKLMDVFIEPSKAYLVCERLLGGNLGEHLHRHRGSGLPPASALEACTRVLRALALCHSRGVLHRDVKPENVLLGRRSGGADEVVDRAFADTSTAKLADFGLSVFMDNHGGHSGGVCGTYAYLAPEIVWGAAGAALDHHQGARFTPQSDTWSAGVCLLYILTGSLPFDPAEIEAAIQGSERSSSRHASRQPSKKWFTSRLEAALRRVEVVMDDAALEFRTPRSSTPTDVVAELAAVTGDGVEKWTKLSRWDTTREGDTRWVPDTKDVIHLLCTMLNVDSCARATPVELLSGHPALQQSPSPPGTLERWDLEVMGLDLEAEAESKTDVTSGGGTSQAATAREKSRWASWFYACFGGP